MGWINNLLANLFGRQPKPNTTPEYPDALPSAYPPRTANTQAEDLDRKVKPWLIGQLKERGNIPFSWESGGDEALLSISGSPAWDSEDPILRHYEDLEWHIVVTLDIPDAGEFRMTGNGEIYLDASAVRIKYSSVLKEVVDYDEEKDMEIFGEDEELDSGDTILFKLS